MVRKDLALAMTVSRVDEAELKGILYNFLSYMESEVHREEHSLSFNDAWLEVEKITQELEGDLPYGI